MGKLRFRGWNFSLFKKILYLNPPTCLLIWGPKNPTKNQTVWRLKALTRLLSRRGVTMYQPGWQSRWWFPTFFCYFHLKIGGRFPIWLIFFRWVGSTTNSKPNPSKFLRLRRCTSSGPPKSQALRVCCHRSWRICRSKTLRTEGSHEGSWGCLTIPNHNI